MYDTIEGVRRGFHAHKCLEQILVPIHGSCKIHLDDGTETAEVVAARLKTAQEEMKSKNLFDYVVINDDVDRAADEVLSIIQNRKNN